MPRESIDGTAIRTVRLLRYLLDGHSVTIDGRTFFFALKGDDFHENWVPVNKWNPAEMMNLADALDGVEYARVMNYEGK